MGDLTSKNVVMGSSLGGSRKLFICLLAALTHLQLFTVDSFKVKLEDLVIAIPADEAHMVVARAGRTWRRGIRTLIAINKQPSPEIIAEGKEYNETWVFYPDDNPKRSVWPGDSRAALVPFLAHKEFAGTYKWLLYGDDDTIFFLEGLLNLLEPYNETLPYFITDHLWWVSKGTDKPTHPNTDAPVCLPCHFTGAGVDTSKQTWLPPKGCPCTPKLLCETDKRNVFNPYCDIPRPLYSMHGGAGALISHTMLEAVPFNWMEACVKSLFSTGGDAFISICLWQAGYAHTHPDQSFYNKEIQHFDMGPEDRMGVMMKVSRALDHKCDGLCKVQLDGMVTLHARSRKFPNFEAAARYIEAMSGLYNTFVEMRSFHRKAADERRAAEQAELAKSAAAAVQAAQPVATRRALTEVTANTTVNQLD